MENNLTQQTPQSTPEHHDSISNLKKIARYVFDVFGGIVILFVVAIIFRLFILQPFIVDGPSMEPNFYNNEYLLVNKISPHTSGYNRGDVVILNNSCGFKKVFL